jgi:hypothetical protein
MTEDELYAGLVRLCQAYGVTTEETYARLREAVETMAENTDDARPVPSYDG